MKTLNQRGSSHIILVLAVIVVAAAGFAGYRVMNASQASPTSSLRSKTSEPASIKSSADLHKASAALDATSIDGAVNPAELDSDMSALL